ncbi:MAG TPA: response regulator, partial [Pseudorhizobium sp.]|nr:response regulator [Pseudorhizobium sp.]
TTVSLLLPVAEAHVAEAPTAAALPQPESRSGSQGPLTVLAVDDDALVLMNTTLMLEDLGHTVIEAFNGQAALDELKRGAPIDLVITDHSMPRMTGAELAEHVAEEWPHLPVILATGYAELPSDKGQDRPKLSKPFSQQQLDDAIRAAVRIPLEQKVSAAR